MKFISAEEFLKQPKEVQDVFRDWWKPEMYDLFFRYFGNNPNNFLHGIYKSFIGDNETKKNAIKDTSFLPLLTIGQLIKFIEDKSGGKIRIIEYDFDHYNIVTFKQTYISTQKDLLQAWWQVACKIAEEEIGN
jgi:hypothetical protein